ncbi:MAG: WYL domain-containing protein [Myxococcales bacterium]|nr:MAG: WYL domain-containing protein [Myxococcales bacterium]
MTQRKAERLMNLTILLLTARHYVTKEQIRAATEPYYTASDDAFERMFDRDKEELRRSGIPIETGNVDAYFDDEIGYRIRRQAFELPEITFTPEEGALLGVAARVWQQAGLTNETGQAITKLKAAGVEVSSEALRDLTVRHIATEAAFTPMWEATMHRQAVEFAYQKPGDLAAAKRRLQPYRITSVQDRWYVVGNDLDRNEPRMFRLSRVVGDVKATGKTDSYDVPDTVDLDALTAGLAPARRQGEATLLVREGRALSLRRRASVVATGIEIDGTSWDRVEVPLHDLDRLASSVLEQGDAVVVEAPEELRDAVVSALTQFVEAAR